MILTSLSFTVECDECHDRAEEFASVEGAMKWASSCHWVVLGDGAVLCKKCAHGEVTK